MVRLTSEVRTVLVEDSPSDPLGAIHRHQVRHGPYPLRLAGAGIAFGALIPAIWLPIVLAGVGSVGDVIAGLVGLLFLGLAANGAMLYQLARGYPPLDLPPLSAARHRAEFRRLVVLTAGPGALVVRALRPWRRSPPTGSSVAGSAPGPSSGGNYST